MSIVRVLSLNHKGASSHNELKLILKWLVKGTEPFPTTKLLRSIPSSRHLAVALSQALSLQPIYHDDPLPAMVDQSRASKVVVQLLTAREDVVKICY